MVAVFRCRPLVAFLAAALATTLSATRPASAEHRPDLEIQLGGEFVNHLLNGGPDAVTTLGWMANYFAAPPQPKAGSHDSTGMQVIVFGPPWGGEDSAEAFHRRFLAHDRETSHLAPATIAGVPCQRGPVKVNKEYTHTLCLHDAYIVAVAKYDPNKRIDDIAAIATILQRLGAIAEEDTVAARCPPPGSDTLSKRAAVEMETVLDFLRTRLAIRSDVERLCFNSTIRLNPDASNSVTPALYDALVARQEYDAALRARQRWFARQRGGEAEAARQAEADIGLATWPYMLLGEAAARTSLLPLGIVGGAAVLFEAQMQHVRDTLVVPTFNEDLYVSYRRLRLQHDPVEAFDIATNRGDSAYHLIVQQMVPRAGAQNLSGEERSRQVAAFWRAWLELRFQSDEILSRGPPNQQVTDALAPAQRCIGGLRQAVARCVADATKAVGR